MGAERHDSIGDIAKDPLKGGADGAYKQLRADVIGTDAYDTVAAHNRMQEATEDMAHNGVLPQVSAAWLKNEFSRIDTSGNGLIERDELKQAEEHQTRYGAFDAAFAVTFDNSLFDKISSMDDRIGQNNISKGDLNRFLRRDDRANRREIAQEDARDNLAPLYNGRDPLINYLNTDGNRRVSRHEMKAFLRDYEQFSGSGPYTEENAKLVNDMLHGRVLDIHHGGAGGFSARHSAKVMGLDSTHGRRNKDFSLVQEDYETKQQEEYLNSTRVRHTDGELEPGGEDGSRPPTADELLDVRDHGETAPPAPEPGPVENYRVKKGDCVWNIAKDHIEPDHKPKNREVHRYVRQISRVNQLDTNGRTPDLIYPGESLLIPPLESER